MKSYEQKTRANDKSIDRCLMRTLLAEAIKQRQLSAGLYVRWLIASQSDNQGHMQLYNSDELWCLRDLAEDLQASDLLEAFEGMAARWLTLDIDRIGVDIDRVDNAIHTLAALHGFVVDGIEIIDCWPLGETHD